MITRLSLFLWGGASWCVECRFECNRSSSDWYWSPRLPESVFRKRQIGICVPSCKRAERIQFYAVVSRWYINNTPAWSHKSTISLLNLSLFIVHPLFFFTCGFFFLFFSLTYSSVSQLHLPLTTPLPGSELTKEPFRWDQRLFALVLRIPGNASVEPEPVGGVPPDDSPITPMCEVTGGRKTVSASQSVGEQPGSAQPL